MKYCLVLEHKQIIIEYFKAMSETKTVPDNLTGNNDNLATMAIGGGMWNNPFVSRMDVRWMNNGYGDQGGDSFKLSRIRCKIITIQIQLCRLIVRHCKIYLLD